MNLLEDIAHQQFRFDVLWGHYLRGDRSSEMEELLVGVAYQKHILETAVARGRETSGTAVACSGVPQ